jgi:uncharacterized heparinase superfamily protein
MIDSKALFSPSSLQRLWYTIRFLQPGQIYHQVRRRVITPRLLKTLDVVPTARPLPLVSWIARPQKYLGGGSFIFLNQEADLGKKIDWKAPGLPRLWQYNLHYFDYLDQQGMEFAEGLSLIRNWIANYPVQPNSPGWDPYPMSLRLVNWIKFFAKWGGIEAYVLDNLLLQAINLKRQLEYNIGGNHLWANGKALWYAGIFLQEPQLATLGKKILFTEIGAQFLPDGGHFELSPMYHAIITEDLLDLINLCKSVKEAGHDRESAILNTTASKALAWLGEVIDGQGQFPLLNDAAYGVAATFKELVEYGNRLGVVPVSPGFSELTLGRWSGKCLSGYRVFSNGPFRLLWDTAPLGPDHLLGHAHCDMLSLLLDFSDENIWTDSGISQYEEGEAREYERGTSAHNTVSLDGLEQAEMWKSFRVGRRGYPQDFQHEGQTLRCSHTGFEIWQPGSKHERALTFVDGGFELTDTVRGPAHHQFKAFFHFSPQVRLEARGPSDFLVNGHLRMTIWGAEAHLTTSRYCPELGKVLPRPCLVLSGEFRQQHSFGLKCISLH